MLIVIPELAASLVSPDHIHSSSAQPLVSLLSGTSVPLSKDGILGRSAEEALLYCHEAVVLRRASRSVSPAHDTTELHDPIGAWKDLWENLHSWHGGLASEHRPILDLPADVPEGSTSNAFPVILFATGAGIMVNQLYHTAILLLLQCKPRTVALVDRSSAERSQLWHAWQVCRIALNNDRWECWDPVLLASLMVAAKNMTHGSQQSMILNGLEKIKGITGWEMRQDLAALQRDWRLGNEV